MYPWHKTLDSWADSTGLRIDALGLVTLLGAEEMDRCIGRLVTSRYFDYLPLLGAYTVAGNRITEKKTGYALYNISAGITTWELAGWFSRWLQAQHFHKVRSKVTWELVDQPRRWKIFFCKLLVSLPLHGVLVAMTILAEDWWGFANVVSMIISVVVRVAQVTENQAGIDANIRAAEKEAEANWAKYEKAKAEFEELHRQGKVSSEIKMPARPRDRDHVKAIVVTQDSKVVTIDAPGLLIQSAFTSNPHIPNPAFYLFCRIMGWIAFAVHVISIGMSALHTQIYSVVLIIGATVLTAYRVGCQDSKLRRTIWNKLLGVDNEEDIEWSCWVTSRLKGTVSAYPAEYTKWDEVPKEEVFPKTQESTEKPYTWPWSWENTLTDLEHSAPVRKPPVIRERRQDLYAWLDLTEEEDERLVAWGLIPHSQEWKDVYLDKKEKHRNRIRHR